MSQTFVYNSGSYTDESENEILNLEFGLFFDGTANNLYNTEARKYMLYEEKFHKKELSEEGEKEIRRIWKEYPEDGTPIYKYTRKQLRAGYKENGKDTSYGNDHTNVARMYLHSERNSYAIYVEGVGTADLSEDNNDGLAYARGVNGLLEKVKKASEDLAQKIKEKYDAKTENNKTENENKIKEINLTIDAFGFSRGATAARHFLYQISNNKHIKLVTKIEDANESFFTQALKKEQLDKLVKKINIRFVGLFDTVVSYDPFSFKIPSFEEYFRKLHLNDIKNPKLVVHFTALDEFRKYFSLTRISEELGIEKNLPGCHSDVGGSYDCDSRYSEEVILGQNSTDFKDLEKLKNKLIEQGWYLQEKTKELVLDNGWALNELTGKRQNLIGHYSYLPLLWMSKYASFQIEEGKLFYVKMEENYVVKTKILQDVKTYLETTTFKELAQQDIGIKNQEELNNFKDIDKKVKENWTFELGVEQDLLKNLRYNYLNQSADYRNTIMAPYVEPNAPNSNRKRQEFNDDKK